MHKLSKIGIIGIRGVPPFYGAFDRFVDQFIGFVSTRNASKNLFFYVGCDLSYKKKKYENPIVKRIFFF